MQYPGLNLRVNMGCQGAHTVDWAHSPGAPAAMHDPAISTSDRRTVVVIVGDAMGWTIDGVRARRRRLPTSGGCLRGLDCLATSRRLLAVR